MKASTILVSILILTSLTMTSCAAPVVNTQAPVIESPVPSEMVLTEPKAPIVDTVTKTPETDAGSEVAIVNFTFAPDSLTVKVGTTVTWTNQDSMRHTVTSDDGFFDSGLFGQGETFSYTFAEAGTYPYYCIPHPYMKGTIIVE